MLQRKDSHAETRQAFRWEIPEYYNIGVDICDKWAEAEPDRLAIIDADPEGGAREYSFGALKARANQLANALTARGINGRAGGAPGDRVGVLLPQSFETAASHVALTKMGCISIPLFTLFGPEALLHRLRDSGTRAVITDAEGARKLEGLQDQLPDLELVLSVAAGSGTGATCFHAACDAQPIDFTPLLTRAEDPAILIYTSGTTGNPKGALHAHRVLLGHLPGVEISHDFLPQPGDRIWTPADWAWIGGLLDVLMPALHHGVPVVACRFAKFRAETAFALMRDQGIRNAFLPPTALKIMRQHPQAAACGLRLRSVASGGESMGAELLQWGREAFGATINEFYGQTECNMIVSSCAALEAPLPGFMGRAVPGHRVEIVDSETGAILPPGTEGAIAVLSPDPVMFLGYWNNAAATADKFLDGPDGPWLLTGDRGISDAEGRLSFVGRDDDVISSAGYRIGPAEIENCLIAHPAVLMAGVVGKPDPLRGAVVAAYLVLNEGETGSDQLAEDIAAHVRAHLAAYEYPRVVRFIPEMPMTTTGKIIRASLRRMAEEEARAEGASG